MWVEYRPAGSGGEGGCSGICEGGIEQSNDVLTARLRATGIAQDYGLLVVVVWWSGGDWVPFSSSCLVPQYRLTYVCHANIAVSSKTRRVLYACRRRNMYGNVSKATHAYIVYQSARRQSSGKQGTVRTSPSPTSSRICQNIVRGHQLEQQPPQSIDTCTHCIPSSCLNACEGTDQHISRHTCTLSPQFGQVTFPG